MGKKKKRKVESISKQPERGMESSFLCSKIGLFVLQNCKDRPAKGESNELKVYI